MKKIVIGTSIIILYCFPFVFFSMYQDFTNHSMVGYLIMVIATFILAFMGQFFCNTIPIILGNILTVLMSIYFNNIMRGTEGWDGSFFKPFLPIELLIIVSVVNLIPQLIAVIVAISLKYRTVG